MNSRKPAPDDPPSRLGWLVQYTDSELIDRDLEPPRWVAENGDVAHVVRLTKSGEWFDLFFERTGLEQTCHVSEFKWLGPPDTGRVPLSEEEKRAHVRCIK